MASKKKHEALDHQQENPNDPVFVPDLSKIEALAKLAPPEGLGGGLAPYSDIYETICGATDDSQAVESYDGSLGVPRSFVDAHERPVGVLRWNSNLAAIYANPGNVSGQRWCTGTLISENLFITAGHCFDQTGGGWNRPRVNGTTNIIPSSEIATNMSVEFGFQAAPNGTIRTPVSVAVAELVEYRLGGIDFAIVRLAGAPGQAWGVARIASVDAAVGDMICIIGHPAGQPKRIEAGPVTSFSGNTILYNDIDTLGGNSGSGILRAADGCIVGIHTNGGCNAAMTGSNFGMRISALRAASPTLQGLQAHTSPALDPVATSVIADRVTWAASDRLTSLLADRPTSVIADRVTWAVADRPTSLIADRVTSVIADRATSVFADQRGTPSKALDDTKAAGLDKQFSDRKTPGFDTQFDPGFDPRVNPQTGGAAAGVQPFVLATPHHATVSEDAGAAQGEAYEAELMRLETTIAVMSDQLERLQAEYEALAAEYTQLLGG